MVQYRIVQAQFHSDLCLIVSNAFSKSTVPTHILTPHSRHAMLHAQMDLGVAQNQAPSAALQATLEQTQQLQNRMAEASGSREDAPAQVPKDWAPQPWSGQHAA